MVQLTVADEDGDQAQAPRVVPPPVRLTSQGVRDLNNHGPRRKPAVAAAVEPAPDEAKPASS